MNKEQIIDKLNSGSKIIDVHNHVGSSFSSFLTFSYPYCLSVEDLAVRTSYLGIDFAVTMPFAGSCYYQVNADSGKVETTDQYCKFPFELENRNMFNEIFEIFPEYSDRFLPFPIFDPSRQAKEQVNLWEELIKRYPVFGLKTCSTYIQSFVNDLETTGRPILDFAEKHNLPLLFHSSYYRKDPWASVFDIIALAENHPELRICIAHTARFTKSVLDRADKLPNCFVDLSAFDIHCTLAAEDSEHIAMGEDKFPADYHNPAAAMNKIASTYPNTIIWGSDTPANYFIQNYRDRDGNEVNCSLKSPYNREITLLKSLPPELITRISYSNTIRFLLGNN